jgi:transposase
MKKYSTEERLEIGRKIYEGEINRSEAAAIYGINVYTARDYMRMYKTSLTIPLNESDNRSNGVYEDMSRDELIDIVLSYKYKEAYERKVLYYRSNGKTFTRRSKQCEFEVIEELSDQFEINRLCRCANVSVDGFYGWKRRHNN